MGKIDIYNLGQLGVNVDADDVRLYDPTQADAPPGGSVTEIFRALMGVG